MTLRTGRFGVTDLEASSVTRTSVSLAWTNPTDDAFAGVVIRRADGPTPPASATDGTAVADLASSDDSVTDTGLVAGTTYSYAVFAHDGASHVAAAAFTTVTTRGNGVSAVLAVNPLPSVHTGDRVTVDTAGGVRRQRVAPGRGRPTWSPGRSTTATTSPTRSTAR